MARCTMESLPNMATTESINFSRNTKLLLWRLKMTKGFQSIDIFLRLRLHWHSFKTWNRFLCVCATKKISGWHQQATFVFVLPISKCFHNCVRWVKTKRNKVGKVKIQTNGDFVDIADNKSSVARELFLQAEDQLSFWKWPLVTMSRSCVFNNTRKQSNNHNHHRRN